MRPHTQLSFELCMWAEGASAVPPWILWCSCLLTFWGLEWLSLSGMRSGTLLVSMVVPRYIYWRSYCVFQHLARSLSGARQQPYWAYSWAKLFMIWLLPPVQSHPTLLQPMPLGKSFQPAPKPYVFPPWWILNSPGLGVNPLQSLPPIFPLPVALFSGMTSWTSIRTLILFFRKYLFTLLSLQIASPLRALWMA